MLPIQRETYFGSFIEGLIVLIFSTLFTSNLYSQNYLDLAKLSYAITPKNTYDTGQDGSAINELGLQFDLPIVLNGKSVLISEFVGNSLHVGLDPSLPDAAQLYSFALRVGLNYKYSETWSGTHFIVPKFSSDFSNGFKDGFQLGTINLWSKIKSPQLKYTFGFYANLEEYGLLVVPLVGGYYESPNEKWEANFLVPAVADVNYLVTDKMRVGMNFDGLGSTYALNRPRFPNAYVTKASNELFAYLRYAITPAVLLNIKTGYAIFRSYRVYAEEDTVDLSIASIYLGDDRTILNTGFKDNFILKFDLIYRLSLPKKPVNSVPSEIE